MNAKAKRIILTWFLCITLVLSTAILGHAYSSILSFGDSLSDNGNDDGFGITRFSNGPVWVEYLASPSHLNVPLLDLAYGGATTSNDNPWVYANVNHALLYTGLSSQVNAYLTMTSNHVPSGTLVTLWAGANDLFNDRSSDLAENNIIATTQNLVNAGAQDILVLNLPNIGATPQFSSGNPYAAAYATAWSQAFNMDLAADLLTLEQMYGGTNFYTLDIYNLFNSAMANPGTYGFTNISDIFWADGLHPSTHAHNMIADYAASSIPEPATIILVLSGLVGLAGLKRKFQR
jgi:phospholipase/lecithinase/hemolysin